LDNNSLYNEKELFQLIAGGDEAAFNKFYLTIAPAATAYAYKILKSWDVVEEIFQESLIRFWLYRDKLADITYPKAYFFRIIANECARYFSKHGFDQTRKKQYEDQYLSADEVNASQTDLEVSYRETQHIIARAVASLPPQRRTIYRMSREEGRTLPEIADKLGVSRDYVKKALMIALQNIRQKLAEEGRFISIGAFLLCLKFFFER